MGSNADLVAYNNALRNIKMHNVPAMASRMAKTILELPRNFMARVDDEGNDHSGEVFDSLWSEIVGHSMSCVGGITLSDCKDIIELVQRLEEHLVKWQSVYVGITSASSEFNSKHAEFTSGKWKSLLDKSATITRSAIRTTYSDLGFSLDQRNLNDDPGFRTGDYYDTYSFLRDVADTPLQDVISAIVVITTSESFVSSNLGITSGIKTVVSKTLSLYSAMADIIHGMNHIIEDMKPVMRTGSKRLNYVYESSVDPADVSLFDPGTKDGWQSPNGTSPRSWYTEFKMKSSGSFMISITTETPYCVESITINGSEINTVNTGDISSKHVYLTDVFECKIGDAIGYTVRDTIGSPSDFDLTKVKFYMNLRGSDEIIPNCDIIEVPIKQETQDTLQFLPITSRDIVHVIVDSNIAVKTGYNVASAMYDGIELTCTTDEDSSKYNPNYTYHYTITMPNTRDKYSDTSKMITVFFSSTVTPEDVNIIQYALNNDDLNSRENPAVSGIIAKEFAGYIDVTDYIVESFRRFDLINKDNHCISSTITIPQSATSSLTEGKFAIGCVSVSPIGEHAFTDTEYLTCSGGVNWKDVDHSGGASVNTPIATNVAYTESGVVVTKSTPVEAESVSDFRFEISMRDSGTPSGYPRLGINYDGLRFAVKRGTRFYIGKVSDTEKIPIMSMYYTICKGANSSINQYEHLANKVRINGYKPSNSIRYLGSDNSVKTSNGLVYLVKSTVLDGSLGLAYGNGIKYALPRLGLNTRYPDVTYEWNRDTSLNIIRLLKSRSEFSIETGQYSGELPVEIASYVCSSRKVAPGNHLFTGTGKHEIANPIISNGSIEAITGVYGNHLDFIYDTYNSVETMRSGSIDGCMDIFGPNDGSWDTLLVEPVPKSRGWKRGEFASDNSDDYMTGESGYPLAMVYPKLAKRMRLVSLCARIRWIGGISPVEYGSEVIRYKLPEPGGIYSITTGGNSSIGVVTDSRYFPGIFYSTDSDSGDTETLFDDRPAYDAKTIMDAGNITLNGHTFYRLPVNDINKDWIRYGSYMSRIYDLSAAPDMSGKPVTHLLFIGNNEYKGSGLALFYVCRLDRV